MMRSILAKILLWSLVTFALSLVAYEAIEWALERHKPHERDPFWSMVKMVEDEACLAFEEGGPERLAAHMRGLDARLPGEHYLTDPRGRDLATGADRSELLRVDQPAGEVPRLPDGRVVFAGKPRGGRYRFVTVARPWFDPPNLFPYYGTTVLVIAGMAAALAVYLAAPIRTLRDTVERFGSGELTARAGSNRRDEIGELSRSFDAMAGRIQTLMSAERRLLQDVSHELRSPLTRLGVAVDLALAGRDPEVALGRIRRDVTRLSDLVGELLQLTRAEGDPAAREGEDVALDHLLRELLDDCALEADAKGCGLALREPEPCHVRGDRELLRRAAENVVRNAVRYAPPGTEVEVTLRRLAGSARVVVRDQGPGVPDDRLGAIFEPFYRAESHRSRASGGVGLGLSIARRAVELHKGEITARNARPGLAVTIVLPLTEAHDRPGAVEAPLTRHEGSTQNRAAFLTSIAAAARRVFRPTSGKPRQAPCPHDAA